MLKSYIFVETDHQKLHDFVVAFFNRIEHETGEFSLDFFEAEFRPIILRHRAILREAFTEIYNEIRQRSQPDRSQLCEEVRQSNNIEQICSGTVNPRRISKTENGIYQQIRTLFLKLYSNVLDGDPVHDELGLTLRQHFDAFRKANKDITLCPMCGISELKTEHDNTRDQYDHYLPKALYPLSSVNFHNLIPTCKECNSFDVKGEKDVILYRNARLFYPYDPTHQGIEVRFSIEEDNADIDKIEWQVDLHSRDGKDQEVVAWRAIYNIDSRYLGFVKGRIGKWYNAYWEYLRDDELNGMAEVDKTRAYFVGLKADETECLSLIRKPALEEFLDKCALEKAKREAQSYTLPTP